MIERCQKQYVRNTDRQFLYISIGVLLICIAIYYIFSFLCSPVVIFYVAGCVACVAVIKSEYVSNYLCILRLYFLCDHVTEESSEALAPKNGCDVCGGATCSRHSEEMLHEPWAGVLIHKQLDKAIEDFYNTILDNFVNSWYNSISKKPFFLHELRTILRYASAALLRRASKINYANLITRKLVPCFLHHYTLYQEAQKMKFRIPDLTLEQAALEGPLKFSMHSAVRSRDAELKYLRSVTEVIMPYLLRQPELQSSVFKILIKEIFAGWVLLSLTDVLADPHIINTIVILATNNGKIAPLPRTPSHRVEILENFVHINESVLTARGKLLNVDLELLLNSPEYFYSFMQFMKLNGKLHLLQFCRDIKIFNNKILKPDMSKNEEVSLFNEAWDLYIQYFVPESRISIAFDKATVEEMRQVLSGGASCVKKLLTSKALYQSYDFVYNVLELNYVPKFLHTDEFYIMLCGPRIPTGFHKQSKKPLEKVSAAAKLGSKLKTAFKTQIVDGQVLNSADTIKISTDNGTEADNIENIDILRYLDNLAEHTMMAERDLTYWRISIHHGEETMLNMKPTRIFTISVRRIDPMLPAEDTTWTVERLESDFHLLKAKLIEFHGETLLADVTTVSRRNNSPMEIIKYKYEGFLQQLLMKPLLRTSELLHLFLTEEGDFSLAAQQASLNAASGSDLVNIYQSVAQKLRKEKGQHLDPFMNAFLVSTDMERYQAMKNDANKELDEAEEVNDLSFSKVEDKSSWKPRCIFHKVFQDNFKVDGEQPLRLQLSAQYQTRLRGFSQCFLFILMKLLNARRILSRLVGVFLSLGRDVIDQYFDTFLNRTLENILCQRRLAHFIRLGQGILFGKKKDEVKKQDPDKQRELARMRLQTCFPTFVVALLGPNFNVSVDAVFEMLQSPQLNKQLLFNLFDLSIAELFPELVEDSATEYT